MAAEEHALTPGEYIIHHLTHFGTGKPKGLVDFSVVNFDSVVLLGRCSARSAASCSGCGRAQGHLGRARAASRRRSSSCSRSSTTRPRASSTTPTSRKLVAPLALTVFVWIVLLNAMDLLPVDLLPLVWGWLYGAAGHDPEHAYLRVVPTADLSITMGLSVGVLILCLYLQHQDQGPRRLAARALRRAVRHRQADRQSAHLDRLPAAVDRQRRDAAGRVRRRRPSRTACGCSATCTPAS